MLNGVIYDPPLGSFKGDNMRKFGVASAMMAFSMLAAPGTANAQVATVLKPVQLGVALGGAIPMSDFGKSFNTGYNLTGTIGINPAGMPVGFRIDAAYNQFGAKGTTNVNAKIAGVSGNVVLSMAGAQMTPYLIGGVGYYRVSSSATGTVASNHFGFNAGAGLQIPLSGFVTFIEARYNRISENGGSTSFIPVTVGVMF
jgi:Outer membrane protein beta-barrel domain